MVRQKTRAIRAMLDAMGRAGTLRLDARELDTTANCMVVVLTYWLNFEYVRDPRPALEPEHAETALLRGAAHVLNLLAPYMESAQREHLLRLTGAYGDMSARPALPRPT
jgi:hypothetical protein